MTKKEILAALKDGKRVFWANGGYEVVSNGRDDGGYDIEYKHNGNRIGLHGLIGTEYEDVLNGNESDFYVSGDGRRPALHIASRRWSLADYKEMK